MHVTLFFRFNSKRASSLIALETSIDEALPNFFFSSLFLAQFDRKESDETWMKPMNIAERRPICAISICKCDLSKIGLHPEDYNLAEYIEKRKKKSNYT